MKVESVENSRILLEEQLNGNTYFVRMLKNLLAKFLFTNSIEDEQNLSLEKAIYRLKDPRTSSLHITPLTEIEGKKRCSTIFEPLSGFDRDAWLLDLLLVADETYLLELLDINNSVVWSETRFVKKESKL